MKLALAVALVLAAAPPSAPDSGQSTPPQPAAAAPSADAAFDRARELLGEARAAKERRDLAAARAKAAEGIELLLSGGGDSSAGLLFVLGAFAENAGDLATAKRAYLRVLDVYSRTLPEDHQDLLAVQENLSLTIRELGDLAGARALGEKVLAARTRTLPEDHADVQQARQNLAATIAQLGDRATARTLFEEALEVYARTLPPDDPALQAARGNLALTMMFQGDLAGARALEEQVVEVFARTLPADHPDLQAARLNLAGTMKAQGDLEGARVLEEEILEIRARTLPDDHPYLQLARQNLAVTIRALGDLEGARALEDKVLEVRSRTLPEGHPALLSARMNLAVTIKDQGDLAGARALEEQVLEVRARTLPADHIDLQASRMNLAITMMLLGDVARAREQLESVLEVLSRTLPDDHPDLQRARNNLAIALESLGDLAGARALLEKVHEVWARTRPSGHPELQSARANLALAMKAQGDLADARAVQESLLAALASTLPADHPKLQGARVNLASTLRSLGELEDARALAEQALESCSRTLPADHPDLQKARVGLAMMRYSLGDLAGARALFDAVLEVRARTLPEDHPDLQSARGNLAIAIATLGAAPRGTAEPLAERETFVELARAYVESTTRACVVAILDASSREAEERVASLGDEISLGLSLADGLGVFGSDPGLDAQAFLASETGRSAALASSRLARRARSSPEYAELAGRVQRASAELSRLAQGGGSADAFTAARARLDEAERELVRAVARIPGSEAIEPRLEALAARIGADEALLAFRRYRSSTVQGGDRPAFRGTDSLCAFVLRSTPSAAARERTTPAFGLERVELGSIGAVEQAVDAWRQAIGAGLDRGAAVESDARSRVQQRGAELRALVLDPLAESLADVGRIVLVPDDVLCTVPLDALPCGGPFESGGPEGDDPEPLGARIRIEVRASLLELLNDDSAAAPGGLLALGHPAFDSEPLGPSADEGEPSVTVALRSGEAASVLHAGAWERGFATLPETHGEVLAIHDYFEQSFGEDAPAEVLERRRASRESLFARAPLARFLHLATHGWFAPESIRSLEDPAPVDSLPGLERMSGEERVRGMSPMLLCGLALAGANRPADATGRIPGLVTAEELATLDLTACELAVLSACDTNVGVRRAGQGVASLQRALQMAGARSVITSLWKVPDEATKELMVDFYRRIWIEGKPKAQALWEAKTKLRGARDESGRPRYATRDWAAWVLTGDPR